jgi:integrase
VPKQGPNRHKRIPKLAFTDTQGIGWHVSFRDDNGVPRRHRFNIKERSGEPQARLLYHAWVLEHLGGQHVEAFPTKHRPPPKAKRDERILSGSILEIASGFLDAEEARSRKGHEPKRRGTIAAPVFRDRKKVVQDFLDFINARRGKGAVSRMRLSDLMMEDVEAFNQAVVEKGFSASQVAKRLQIVKAIIDRAGRPEHGGQMLSWNWDSRDVLHGKPTDERMLPTREQLIRMLRATDLRGRTMIWLGIGLGFGARDLAAIRVGQITPDAYDLRRSKTGVERFGETPPRVWHYVSKYQTRMNRPAGQLLFLTKHGVPLVQPTSNAVTQWWQKLRDRIGKCGETLPGFYTLRHLGATEFGSRPGTSISDVKRWLGHAASSGMADVYMRPVRPEFKEVIEWVRSRLQTPAIDDEHGLIKLRHRKPIAKKSGEAR